MEMRNANEREYPCLFSYPTRLRVTFRLQIPILPKRCRRVSRLMRSCMTKARPTRALRDKELDGRHEEEIRPHRCAARTRRARRPKPPQGQAHRQLSGESYHGGFQV